MGLSRFFCSFPEDRPIRHGFSNDGAQKGLSTREVQLLLEPTGVSDDSGKRPDGKTLASWINGKPIVWDVTCVEQLFISNHPH